MNRLHATHTKELLLLLMVLPLNHACGRINVVAWFYVRMPLT
jgi:hypothetical protein